MCVVTAVHIPHAWPLGIIEVSGLGAAEVIIPLGPFFSPLVVGSTPPLVPLK